MTRPQRLDGEGVFGHERWKMPDGSIIYNVHRGAVCEGRPCVIHNPTPHRMSRLPLLYRRDRKIFERICEHGIGHPDPDQFDFWDATGQGYQSIHGCDGCCGA